MLVCPFTFILVFHGKFKGSNCVFDFMTIFSKIKELGADELKRNDVGKVLYISMHQSYKTSYYIAAVVLF